MYVPDKPMQLGESTSHQLSRPATQQQHQDMPISSTNAVTLPTLSPAPNRQTPPSMNGSHDSRQHFPMKRRRSDEDGGSTSPQDTLKSFSVRPKLSNASMDHTYINSEQLQREAAKLKAESDVSGGGFPLAGISDSASWDVDPVEISRDDTVRLLGAFFAQSIASCNNLFPKRSFWTWATTNTRKTSEERMVLLCMLAVGGVIAKDKSAFAQTCAERASLAVASNFGKFGLPLVQARLLLAVFRYAKGHDNLASEYCSGATHSAKMAALNTEEGCAADADSGLFGLKREQLKECRRRVFWAVLLLDVCLISHSLCSFAC